MSPMAIEAKSASDVERKNYAVSFLDAFDCFSHVLDYTHDFVAHNGPVLKRRTAVIHMKIAATYAAGRHSQQCIGRSLDLGFGMINHCHFVSAFVTDCFHKCLQKSISSTMPGQKGGDGRRIFSEEKKCKVGQPAEAR